MAGHDTIGLCHEVACLADDVEDRAAFGLGGRAAPAMDKPVPVAGLAAAPAFG